MSIIKRAAAGLSAAAVALSLAIPVSVSAAEEHTVTLHYEDFNGDSPLVLNVEDGQHANTYLSGAAFNHNGSTLEHPEPSGGKAVVGWKTEGSSEEYNFNTVVTEDLDLYPILADTVEAGTLTVTAEDSVMPSVGADVPANFADKITVPDGFTVTRAYYTGDGTTFADNSVYVLRVELKPEDGKVFDFTYNVKDEAVFNVEGATLNGTKANLSWNAQITGSDSLTVSLPISLGDPETVELTVHYGHGIADKTVNVPKDTSLAPYFDQAAGELAPEAEGYAFVGWYKDPEFSSFFSYGLTTRITQDTEIYAKWAKVIDEISFNIETPLCGEEVENENGGTLTAEMLRQQTGDVAINDMEDAAGTPIVLTNEPDVTTDTEGIEPHAAWIDTEVPLEDLQYDTIVDLFTGTIYGENDYTFVINVETSENGEMPYFAKDLKITVNGVTAEDGAAVMSANSMTADSAFGAASISFDAKPSTKAGIVSKANVVSKGGNSFTVVGMITADHVWDDGVITKEPGCEDEGVKTYTCRSKDASYTDEIDAYGHRWLDWEVVKPATATEEGLEMRRCSNDGEHTETRVIPATGVVETPESTDESAPEPTSPAPGGTVAPSGTGTATPTGGGAAAPLALTAAAAALAVAVIRRRK